MELKMVSGVLLTMVSLLLVIQGSRYIKLKECGSSLNLFVKLDFETAINKESTIQDQRFVRVPDTECPLYFGLDHFWPKILIIQDILKSLCLWVYSYL